MLGVETLVQHETARNTIWTSVTFSRAEYTYPTLQSATFPASNDRLGELKIADTVRFARVWSINGAFVAASGRPQTPVSGVDPVWFPSGEAIYRIAFGGKNSARLPVYHRFDLSGQREVHMGAVAAIVGATLFNVYDRRNAADTEYELANAEVTSNGATLMRRAVNVFVRFAF